MGFMYKYATLLFATGSWGLITSTIEANVEFMLYGEDLSVFLSF